MVATRSSHARNLGFALATAAALSGGVAWVSTSSAGTPEPERGLSFWRSITPTAMEIDLPESVDEIAQRSDAIVVAHVTDVTEGREDRGLYDPTPTAPGTPELRTVFVYLAVDRVVHGEVSEQQVLKLEMYHPPRTSTIAEVRKHMPPGQMLFFLFDKAEEAPGSLPISPSVQLQEKSLWGPVTLSRAVIAQGPNGLYPALHPSEETAPFIASFDASTVEGAADRAAQAVR